MLNILSFIHGPRGAAPWRHVLGERRGLALAVQLADPRLERQGQEEEAPARHASGAGRAGARRARVKQKSADIF